MRLAKFALTGAAAALVTAGTFGAGAALAQTDTVKVGVIYPLSGPVAQAGKDSLAAVEAAVDVVNNKHDFNMPLASTEGLPNLGGAKIELVVGDHQGKPELGRADAERLITQENVVALIGAYHSSVSAAASNVAERMEVPFLTGESSSPELTERGLKWFFRTGPHDGHYTAVMFDFNEQLKKDKG